MTKIKIFAQEGEFEVTGETDDTVSYKSGAYHRSLSKADRGATWDYIVRPDETADSFTEQYNQVPVNEEPIEEVTEDDVMYSGDDDDDQLRDDIESDAIQNLLDGEDAEESEDTDEEV